MKKFLELLFGILLPWLLLFYLTSTPQVVLIKHSPPEQNQFIYRSSLWVIPLGFILLILLNLLLKKTLPTAIKTHRGATLFDAVNRLILVYNILLVGYLIYLNY